MKKPTHLLLLRVLVLLPSIPIIRSLRSTPFKKARLKGRLVQERRPFAAFPNNQRIVASDATVLSNSGNNNNNNNNNQSNATTFAAVSSATIETTIAPTTSRWGSFKSLLSNFLSEPWVEVVNGGFVLLSSLLVAISTLNNLSPAIGGPIQTAQDVIAVIFLGEFVLRWAASSDPHRHLTRPLVLVDIAVVVVPFLVSIAPPNVKACLPGMLTSSSSLINLRLLRILRLQRVLQDMESFTRFEKAMGVPSTNIQPWQLQLARVVLSLFTLLSVATGLIYTAEHTVNPQFTDYFTALYFGLTTLTTVGFGDVTPITWQGKLVVSGSILAGVAIIPAQCAALVDSLLERQKQSNDKQTAQLERKLGIKSVVSLSSNSDRMVLETTVTCPVCSTAMHWSSARYCWSCGSELQLQPDEDGDNTNI